MRAKGIGYDAAGVDSAFVLAPFRGRTKEYT
jgi:hypothetical protein